MGKDEASLEAAIVESPDKTAAYLVYGDWLQERDEPHGELVSVQHALAEAPTIKACRSASASFSRSTRSTSLARSTRAKARMSSAMARSGSSCGPSAGRSRAGYTAIQ